MRAYLLFSVVGSLLGVDLLMQEPVDSCVNQITTTLIDTSKLGWDYDSIPMDRASSYYPSFEQCARRDSLGNIDSSSNIYNTADGSHISMEKLRKQEINWIALPRHMLIPFGGKLFNFGDEVSFYSESKNQINKVWKIHDVVSGEWDKTVDFLIHPDNNRNPKLGLPKDVILLYNKKPVYVKS